MRSTQLAMLFPDQTAACYRCRCVLPGGDVIAALSVEGTSSFRLACLACGIAETKRLGLLSYARVVAQRERYAQEDGQKA